MAKDYPKEFNSKDFSLSGFLSEVAIHLWNHTEGDCKEDGYDAITHASEIFKNGSRKFRIEDAINHPETLLIWEYRGRPYNETLTEAVNLSNAKELIDLSERLSLVKELPPENVRDLSSTCSDLSRRTMIYWNSKNPEGFRK